MRYLLLALFLLCASVAVCKEAPQKQRHFICTKLDQSYMQEKSRFKYSPGFIKFTLMGKDLNKLMDLTANTLETGRVTGEEFSYDERKSCICIKNDFKN